MATHPVSGAGTIGDAPTTQPHLGEQRLTTLHAIGQALAIGPIFSVGLVSGLVANVAGFSTPASIVLGSIGSIGLAYVIAIYARRYAGAGAIFEYLSHAVHNSFGIFSAPSTCSARCSSAPAGSTLASGSWSRASSKATSTLRSRGGSVAPPASRSRSHSTTSGSGSRSGASCCWPRSLRSRSCSCRS